MHGARRDHPTAVYPFNRNITAKVRRFVQVLAKRFEGNPDFVA